MKIKLINKSNNDAPKYATIGSSGVDIRAYLSEKVVLNPMERKMIKTGLYLELPIGYEAQIRCRSGLAIKNGISLINNIGTIDSDYRGEICVLIVNLSDTPFEINNGDRIAQMVICKYERVDFELVNEISQTERGEGGFNSTGIK